MRNDRNQGITAKLGGWLLTVLILAGSVGTALAKPGIQIADMTGAQAGDVTVSVIVSEYNLGGEQGAIVYYLDSVVPTYYEHPAISKAGTYAVSADTSHTWKNVTPGEHRFSVQLVNKDVMPLPAPVIASATVTVGTPGGPPQLSIVNPADGDTLPPGMVYLAVEVGGFIVSRVDMGVVNRAGEGHLMYYMDETPPTDPGVPATTERSIVSTDTNHLWKNITEGQHTFSVQLVNNDDTPLDTPVTATVTLDIKP
jgi:hypothetical protein